MVKNTAFVFIKPHAVTDKTKELVKKTFEEKSIKIVKEGEISAEDIDKKKLIDQHYYAIASKATLLKPDKLNVPKDKFKEKFGVDWDESLKAGTVFNAMDACEELKIDAAELDKMWGGAKKAGTLIKFGGGFYCASLEKDGKKIYAFNGFFMSMRGKFVAPGTSIYYYVVEWDSDALAWADFRGKVLGPTDPADAPADSLRGLVMKQWKELGLKDAPNTGDNGVHASASPFEALAERMNWLGYRANQDSFGKLLLKAGVTTALIKAWSVDPQVTYGVLKKTGSLFDSLEDQDSDDCLCTCGMIASYQKPKEDKKVVKLEKEIAKLKEELAAYEGFAKVCAQIGMSGGKGKGKGKGSAMPGLKGKGKGKGKSKGKSKGKGKGKGKSWTKSWW